MYGELSQVSVSQGLTPYPEGFIACYYSRLPNKRTGMLNFDDVLRQIYVILTVLEFILSELPALGWFNQVSTRV